MNGVVRIALSVPAIDCEMTCDSRLCSVVMSNSNTSVIDHEIVVVNIIPMVITPNADQNRLRTSSSDRPSDRIASVPSSMSTGMATDQTPMSHIPGITQAKIPATMPADAASAAPIATGSRAPILAVVAGGTLVADV